MAVRHRLPNPWRADRPRLGQDARGVPRRTHLRAARHEGYRPACPKRSSIGSRPAIGPLAGPAGSSSSTTCAAAASRALRCFESGSGGLVSTVDDYLAFCRMMLNKGTYGRGRILSRPSVELMTTDQITPAQKAGSPFFENFWDNRGWGFGLSIITRRDDSARCSGPVRLGRRLRYVRVLRSQGGHGRHPDDAARGIPRGLRASCSISGPPPIRRSMTEWRGPGDQRRRQM